MYFKRAILLLIVLVLAALPFSGCGGAGGNSTNQDKAVVRLGALKGPSSLGLLQILNKNDRNESLNIYEVTVEGAPSDIQARLLNGELDIAALPSNLASVLYNRTEKNIRVIAVSTLGVLYLLSTDDTVTSFEDIEGRTVYATGQGSTPEYVLDYLLRQNGLEDKVDVQYKGEHAELAALMASGGADTAMLPQPFVTTVMLRDDSIRIVADLNDEWREAAGAELAMTCIVVRNRFLEENRDDVHKFLREYEESASFVNTNVEKAAVFSEKYDIIPEAVARTAIPKCAIVFIDGGDMRPAIEPLLQVLYDANPGSMGGALPDDTFYYKK